MSPLVKIRRFSPEDYSQLIGWNADREVSLPPLDTLSDVGFIVDDVACGFLYLTNSSVAFLEAFMANPRSDKNDRDSALNWITIHLLDLAKASGVKVIKCETKLEAVTNRALSLGFKDIGRFTGLIKEI